MKKAGSTDEVKIYGYRWVILAVFVFITILIAIQWLTFAPIAREAKTIYGVEPIMIDLLSMVFMGVFLVICIPASYVIDTYGIRIGIGFGALLTGVFGLTKGLFAESYTMVMISQIGLAVGQPFIINASTKVAARWFPVKERATAVGLATLAQFIGIIIAMMASPELIKTDVAGVYNISRMLMVFGIASVVGAIILIVFLREQPPTPPVPGEQEEKFNVFEGFKHILKKRDMILILLLFFIGLGMFNAISTCIDQICELKHLTIDQTGIIGGVMLAAGILGAIVLPILSDSLQKRKIFLTIGMVFMTPGVVGLTFFTDFTPVFVSSAVLGFFLLGAGAPVGFQYSAEIGHPAPESSTQGIILLVGQISGILFIIGMNALGMIPFMKIFIGLSVVTIILTLILKESPMVGQR